MKDTLATLRIENEQTDDIEGIRRVNLDAFEGDGEADVVDMLRDSCPVFVSLVAKMGISVVGHILFTPVSILQEDGCEINGMGLAPLAVLPEFQNMGIGSALCQEGLRRLASDCDPFVIVLGHPNYYPRFGFSRASAHGITCAYLEVPDEAFMIHVFNPSAMRNVKGVAHYRPEFDTIT